MTTFEKRDSGFSVTGHQREFSDDSWTGPGPVAERRRQEEQEAQLLKEKEEQLRAMEVSRGFGSKYIGFY